MKTKLLVIAVSIAVFIGGLLFWRYNQATNQQAIMTLNAQEKETVDAILKDKKTYCIGNYNIELPDGMVMDKETKPVIRFDDVSLVSQRMYYPAFEQRIRLREAELKQTKPINPADSPYLKSVHPLTDGVKGVIFERMESIGVPDSARYLEAHFYKDNVAFLLGTKARNGEGERYEKYRNEYPRLYTNNVPQKINVLNRLIETISGKTDQQSSHGSSLCFPDGSIASTSIEKNKAIIAYTLFFKNQPDLFITLDYDNHTKNQDSLVEFKSYDESQIKKRGGEILDKGFVDTSYIHAEQWLSKDILHNGHSFYDFYLVVNGRATSKDKPKLTVNMSLEKKDNSAHEIDDSQMLAIWNEIITTIQPR